MDNIITNWAKFTLDWTVVGASLFSVISHFVNHGLLSNTSNCGCTCAGNARNVFPATTGKQSRHASRHVLDARAVMHAGIANSRFPLNSTAGENVPGIPGACAKRNFTHLVRSPLWELCTEYSHHIASLCNISPWCILWNEHRPLTMVNIQLGSGTCRRMVPFGRWVPNYLWWQQSPWKDPLSIKKFLIVGKCTFNVFIFLKNNVPYQQEWGSSLYKI